MDPPAFQSPDPRTVQSQQSINNSARSATQSLRSNRSDYSISVASGYQQSLAGNGSPGSPAHIGPIENRPLSQSLPDAQEKRNSTYVSPSTSRVETGRHELSEQYVASPYILRLLQYARQLQGSETVSAPGFMECQALRNTNLIDLNNKLARYNKIFFGEQSATADDLVDLRKTLHEQAEAIRDYEYICSLDYLSAARKQEQIDNSYAMFPDFGDVDAFNRRAYRTFSSNRSSLPAHDSVLHFLITVLPRSLTWTEEEKRLKKDLYEAGCRPMTVSATVERFARFLIAMAGALFILVPMYIMAIKQNQNKNLITTTVAVILFAVSTSVALRMSSDQTLAATFGYAAVLMVFVGLSS